MRRSMMPPAKSTPEPHLTTLGRGAGRVVGIGRWPGSRLGRLLKPESPLLPLRYGP